MLNMNEINNEGIKTTSSKPLGAFIVSILPSQDLLVQSQQ